MFLKCHFYFFIIISIFTIYANSDTTFGPTKTYPKEDEGVTSSNSEKDTGSFGSYLLGIIFRPIVYVLIEPFKQFVSKPVSTSAFDKRIYYSLGFSYLDFFYYNNIAFGYSFKFDFDFLYPLNEFIILRESISAELSPGARLYSNFERNVYVNGNLIGQEKDIGSHYNNFSFPINTEALFKPFGSDGSLFFIVGAGPRYVYEKLIDKRNYTYQSQITNITIKDGKWIPSFNLGIGRMFDLDDFYILFELNYSLGINTYNRSVSLPSENTQFVHSIALMDIKFLF
jgi:hypothetical protein